MAAGVAPGRELDGLPPSRAARAPARSARRAARARSRAADRRPASVPAGTHADPAAAHRQGDARPCRRRVLAADREVRVSPAGGRWRTLARDLGIAFSSQVFYKLTGYVTLALLTRYLDKAAMGQFFFTATLAGTAVLFTELGTHRTLVRSAASDPERALIVTSEILSFRLPLFALYFALVNAFTLLVRPELLAVMLLTSLYVGLEELYLSFGSLFVGIQRLGHNAIAGICCKLVLIGLILFVMRANLGFRAILVAHVVANAVLVLVAYIIVRRRLGPVRLSWRSGRARNLTAESFPLFAVAMLSLLHAKADT